MCRYFRTRSVLKGSLSSPLNLSRILYLFFLFTEILRSSKQYIFCTSADKKKVLKNFYSDSRILFSFFFWLVTWKEFSSVVCWSCGFNSNLLPPFVRRSLGNNFEPRDTWKNKRKRKRLSMFSFGAHYLLCTLFFLCDCLRLFFSLFGCSHFIYIYLLLKSKENMVYLVWK